MKLVSLFWAVGGQDEVDIFGGVGRKKNEQRSNSNSKSSTIRYCHASYFFRSHPPQSPSKKMNMLIILAVLFAQRSSRVPTHFSLRKTGEKDVIAPNISSMNKTTQTHQSRENSLSVSFRKAACTQFPLLLFFSVWQYQARRHRLPPSHFPPAVKEEEGREISPMARRRKPSRILLLLLLLSCCVNNSLCMKWSTQGKTDKVQLVTDWDKSLNTFTRDLLLVKVKILLLSNVKLELHHS